MSYLSPTRLTFAGRFRAAPSTVNNDPVHYDNDAFKKNYQDFQTKSDPNGWWNPTGNAVFGFSETKLQRAYVDGCRVELPETFVLGAPERVSGKIVDLDPEQQLVSEIWGMEVRLADSDGNTLMHGHFAVAPFTNIWWQRVQGAGGGDISASAVYQSTLSKVEWGEDRLLSSALVALKNETKGDKLSIRFIVDSYNMDHTDAYFTFGRVAGAIGPYQEGEPTYFTPGRQFFPKLALRQGTEEPTGKLYFANATICPAAQRLLVDLGNALPVQGSVGPMVNLGDLDFSYTDDSGSPVVLGTLAAADYTAEHWYEDTSGIVSLALSPAQFEGAADAPLKIRSPAGAKLDETPGGYHVRADRFVHRLYPDPLTPDQRFEPKEVPANEAAVRLFATRFGQPLPNAQITCFFDDSQLQPSTSVSGRQAPVVGMPQEALSFERSIQTDANGVATLRLTASDPQNPRRYIDGQVYGVRYCLTASLAADYVIQNVSNPSDFISVLVWNKFDGDASWESILPVLQLYANLYPIMDQFLDLTSPQHLAEKAKILQFVFSRDQQDPNYMPVTRDLSPAKRAAVIAWLVEAQSGTLAAAPTASSTGQAKPPLPTPPTESVPTRGGKTLAAERRIQNRRR